MKDSGLTYDSGNANFDINPPLYWTGTDGIDYTGADLVFGNGLPTVADGILARANLVRINAGSSTRLFVRSNEVEFDVPIELHSSGNTVTGSLWFTGGVVNAYDGSSVREIPYMDTGGPSGNRVAFWSSSNQLDGEASFAYIASQNRAEIEQLTLSNASAANDGTIGYDGAFEGRRGGSYSYFIQRADILTGSASPSGSQVPDFVGQIFVDTTGNNCYMATGLTNTDWVQLN